MSKPDWKDAPEWADWLVLTRTGEWVWFASEPGPAVRHKEPRP